MFEIQDISSRLLLVSDGLLVCEEFEYLLLFIIYFFIFYKGRIFPYYFLTYVNIKECLRYLYIHVM